MYETMFEGLTENACSIKIDIGNTSAKYSLCDVDEFRRLLIIFGE